MTITQAGVWAQQIHKSANARRFWLAERAALPLDVFRIAAGAALSVHFGLQLLATPRLLANAGLDA